MPGGDGAVNIEIYCTNKGRHGRSQVALLTDYRSTEASDLGFAGLLPNGAPVKVNLATRHRREGRDVQLSNYVQHRTVPSRVGRDAWEFTCSRCGRKPRLPTQRLLQIIDSGSESLRDISNWRC